MLLALLNRTGVVMRGTAGTPDAAGAPVVVWAGVAQAAGVAVVGAATGTVRCRVEAVDSRAKEEVKVGKQLVRADWRVWLEAGVDVTEKDRLVLDDGRTLGVELEAGVDVTEKDRLVLDDGRTLGVELVARYRGGVGDHLEVYGVEVRV